MSTQTAKIACLIICLLVSNLLVSSLESSAQSSGSVASSILNFTEIEQIMYTKDGQHVLMLTPEGIFLLNKDTHEIVRTYAFPEDINDRVDTRISEFDLSPTQDRIGATIGYYPRSGYNAHRLVAWNYETGEIELNIDSQKEAFLSICFSPDGNKFYLTRNNYGGDNFALRVLDSHTGESLATYQSNTFLHYITPVQGTDLCWITDWKASGGRNGVMTLFDMTNGNKLKSLQGHTDYIFAADITPDGKRLITASMDETVRIWDTETGETLQIIETETNNDCPLALTDDGRYAVISHSPSGYDQLFVWDIENKEKLFQHIVKEGITSLNISIENNAFLLGTRRGSIKEFSLPEGEVIQKEYKYAGKIDQVIFKDQNQVLMAGLDQIHVYDLNQKKLVQQYSIPSTHFGSLTAAINPPLVAYRTGEENQIPVLHNWETGITTTLAPSFEEYINLLAISNDKQLLAVNAGPDYMIRVWDLSSNELLYQVTLSDYIHNMVFSPDGNRIAVSLLNSIIIYDAKSGLKLQEINVPFQFRDIVYSPDQKWIVICGEELALLSTFSLQIEHYLSTGDWSYTTAEFSHDLNYLFAGTNYNTIELWDFNSLTYLNTLGQKRQIEPEFYDGINQIELSENNSELVCVQNNAFGQYNLAKHWMLTEDFFKPQDSQQPTETPTASPTATPFPPTPTPIVVDENELPHYPTSTPTMFPIVNSTFQQFFKLNPINYHGAIDLIAQNPNDENLVILSNNILYNTYIENGIQTQLWKFLNLLEVNYNSRYQSQLFEINSDEKVFFVLSDYKSEIHVAWPSGKIDNINLQNYQDIYFGDIRALLPIRKQHQSLGLSPSNVLVIVRVKRDNLWYHELWIISHEEGQWKLSPFATGDQIPQNAVDLEYGPNDDLYLLTTSPTKIYKLLDTATFEEWIHHLLIPNVSDQTHRNIYAKSFIYSKTDNSFIILTDSSYNSQLYYVSNEQEVYPLLVDDLSDSYVKKMIFHPSSESVIVQLNNGLISIQPNATQPTPQTPTPTPLTEPEITGWFVLDGFGGIHKTSAESEVPALPYIGNFNIMRDLEPDPLGQGWYLLDGFGGIHVSNQELPVPKNLPYFGFDIARSLEIVVENNERIFYLLDGYGVVHSSGDLFEYNHLPWFGFDAARDLEPNKTDSGWSMLDSFAIIHFSNKPKVDWPLGGTMQWNPMANSFVRFNDERTLILDGYGAVHTNPFYKATPIEGLPEGFYFPGWNIIQDIEMVKE